MYASYETYGNTYFFEHLHEKHSERYLQEESRVE